MVTLISNVYWYLFILFLYFKTLQHKPITFEVKTLI